MNKFINVYKKNKKIINYIIVGGLTTLVSLDVYYISVFTFLDPNKPIQLQVANVISWIVSITFAYITNRKFVFESKEKNIFKECVSFFSSRILTLFIDMLFMFVFVSELAFNDKIMKIVVQIIVIVSNYIISKFLVFKKSNV